MKKLLAFLFSVSLICTFAQTASLAYGPYLQQAGPNSVYVCWRTKTPGNSKISYGLSKTNLTWAYVATSSVTDHQHKLSGLIPNTKYYYTIGTTAQLLAPDTFYFYTAPLNGTKQRTRIIALGDCGTGYAEQTRVRDALSNYVKNNYINCVLLLGDNAYNNGLDSEYTANFFTPYQSKFIFPNSCIYPAPGNHDYSNSSTLQVSHAIAYNSIFKTPVNAELGGVASNHKEFYSYNYANIHFISLDSYGIESGYRLSDTLGPQYSWLKQDLINNTQQWTVVYLHHPPYTMGSHNSDTEQELIDIRQNIAKLLDKNKVDLVISGHSHSYERSWLMNGHYGLENTFNKAVHTVDSSSAKYDGSANSCPYVKNTNAKGTVYVVAGASGKNNAGQSSFPHKAMYYSEDNRSGALYFEVNDNRLDAKYIGADSSIRDQFTILKNVKNVFPVYVNSNASYTLTASWTGNYNWIGQSNFTQSFSGIAVSNTVIIVRDSLNCLTDTFNVFKGTGINELNEGRTFRSYPNPGFDLITIELDQPETVKEVKIISATGVEEPIEHQPVSGGLSIDVSGLLPGFYTLKLLTINKQLTQKIIVIK